MATLRKRRGTDEHHVLSTTTIKLWAVALLVIAGLMVTALWALFGTGDAADTARLDVIRTAATIVVGTGGAAALLLTARRQRVTELDVMQKDHDATERRVTELYGKAADQLGSEKAPVRLAGLYALERLAIENPMQRQTIVDLICAYLRMRGTVSVEESQVRQAATELLTKHLHAKSDTFWPGTDINLSSATLAKFILTHCEIRSARFTGTTFDGPASFRDTTIKQLADFREARFLGLADFRNTMLEEAENPFRGARFERKVDFGTRTQTSLAGARTRTDHTERRKWPAGWVEVGIPDQPSWARLAHKKDFPEPHTP